MRGMPELEPYKVEVEKGAIKTRMVITKTKNGKNGALALRHHLTMVIVGQRDVPKEKDHQSRRGKWDKTTGAGNQGVKTGGEKQQKSRTAMIKSFESGKKLITKREKNIGRISDLTGRIWSVRENKCCSSDLKLRTLKIDINPARLDVPNE